MAAAPWHPSGAAALMAARHELQLHQQWPNSRQALCWVKLLLGRSRSAQGHAQRGNATAGAASAVPTLPKVDPPHCSSPIPTRHRMSLRTSSTQATPIADISISIV